MNDVLPSPFTVALDLLLSQYPSTLAVKTNTGDQDMFIAKS